MSLHKYFEEQTQQREHLSKDQHQLDYRVSKIHRFHETVRRKYDQLSKKVHENYINNSSDDDNFMEYIKQHKKDGLEERRMARMKKRETKLNMMNEEMLKQERIVSSFRKHIRMRNTMSVKYRKRSLDDASTSSQEETLSQSSSNNVQLQESLEILIDGPFGSPSSNIYRAEHAVLIGTGIGITPFASILQSIMHRYWNNKQTCPRCEYKWTKDSIDNLFSLQKVDFFWINRDHTSFE